MTDVDQGREALRNFHNASLGYNAYTPQTLDELVNLYGKKKEIYLDGIGGVIRETGMNVHQVADAMESLAKRSQGKIPKDHQGYISALGNQAAKISYLDLGKTVATEVTKQVVDGAVAVGDNVVTTLKIMNFIWPVALLVFLGFWYNGKVKKYT